ncbi:glycosyltransferase [Halieaceae bacterium IMCC14734]|uniref:Glycosyltransferase n=1 Tax=Candidatus Litorirhabdus singularis TaxID=2518993 RepID=A0ABT3TG63_9GAMM|nr:glycosyltransferase [Candidatus Litorirhabdus singularis]MCX2981298.1 glycosyltransferase [Candidatus Litorirhabdus singularis]
MEKKFVPAGIILINEKLLVWGTYDTGKPRTRILIAASRLVFGEVIECHRDVWGGVEDKSQLTGVRAKLGILTKWLFAYPVLIFRYLRAPKHNLVLIPYMGIIDIIILYPFARMRGAKICLDIFISIYDTTVIDRELLNKEGIIAKLLYYVEHAAINLADIRLIDTWSHAKYIEELFGMPADSVQSVWVGMESEKFPRKIFSSPSQESPERVKVLFYGQFIPLHGIDVIVEAAELLEQSGACGVEWILIGKGQLQTEIDEMIRAKVLNTITRIEWVPYDELIENIVNADICLGVFNAKGKSLRVIPNKVFQILAAGTALITADSPAMNELISEETPGIMLVRPGSASDLAEAVLKMSKQLSQQTLDTSNMPLIDSRVVAEQFRDVVERSFQTPD